MISKEDWKFILGVFIATVVVLSVIAIVDNFIVEESEKDCSEDCECLDMTLFKYQHNGGGNSECICLNEDLNEVVNIW